MGVCTLPYSFPRDFPAGNFPFDPTQAYRKPASKTLRLAFPAPLVGSDQVQELPMQELKTWLPASVTLVHLPQTEDAGGQATPDYLIRSQPDVACMSTMEAIARCDLPFLASHMPNPRPLECRVL